KIGTELLKAQKDLLWIGIDYFAWEHQDEFIVILQSINPFQKCMVDIHLEVLINGSNFFAQRRDIIIHNDQLVKRHLFQIANDLFIEILVSQMLVLEVRHDYIIVIGSHVLIQNIKEQLWITMVDIQIDLSTGT